MQGFTAINSPALDIGLGSMKEAFPNASFPLGCVHEFLSELPEAGAATGGFITALLTSLMGNKGSIIWISTARKIFPPALKSFGVAPDRFIFVDLQKEKDVIWAMDEALKCAALTAVVGEVRDIDFTASRRLQLAVEQSKVTGFVIRNNKSKPGTTACVSRWRIMPLPSESLGGDAGNWVCEVEGGVVEDEEWKAGCVGFLMEGGSHGKHGKHGRKAKDTEGRVEATLNRGKEL